MMNEHNQVTLDKVNAIQKSKNHCGANDIYHCDK
jgi:hypothetical protein